MEAITGGPPPSEVLLLRPHRSPANVYLRQVYKKGSWHVMGQVKGALNVCRFLAKHEKL